MNLHTFFLNLAKPLMYNLPKGIVFILLTCLFSGKIIEALANKRRKKLWSYIGIIFIISVGLYARLCFSYFTVGNSDLRSWHQFADFTISGKNIYAATNGYNYFPPWIIILKFLRNINLYLLPELSFPFIIKVFLTIVDCLILWTLFLLCRLNKFPFIKVASLFFLNPVSIILTGYHGQFENIAILFFLLGIYFYQKNKKLYPALIVFTLGGITKHMFYNQILIFLKHIFPKDKIKILKYFLLSLILAFFTLLPYWQEGRQSIIKNLFLYSINSINYGIPYILHKLSPDIFVSFYKYFFLILFIGLPIFISNKNIFYTSLMGTLTFITFASGMCDQYLLAPIAIGSLSHPLGFYLYTIFTSIYFIGSPSEFDVRPWRIFSNNTIWLISLIWFTLELFKRRKAS